MAISVVVVLGLLAGSPPPPPLAIGPACAPLKDSNVASLRGQYRVIGVRGGTPYTGTLALSGSDGASEVTLSGHVDGSAISGTARKVLCGAIGCRSSRRHFTGTDAISPYFAYSIRTMTTSIERHAVENAAIQTGISSCGMSSTHPNNSFKGMPLRGTP